MRLNSAQQQRLDDNNADHKAKKNICAGCGQTHQMSYCGRCDMFYSGGHAANCPQADTGCDDIHGLATALRSTP